MLREVKTVRQDREGLHKRWFTDAEFDLFTWQNESGRVVQFELCYGKRKQERSLRWADAGGYLHSAVDDGEAVPGRHKMTPILITDGPFRRVAVAEAFRAASREIDPLLAGFVAERLLAAPESGGHEL